MNEKERFQMEPFLQWSQESTHSGLKWNGANGSCVNSGPIRTNFEYVPFGSNVNGVLIRLQND